LRAHSVVGLRADTRLATVVPHEPAPSTVTFIATTVVPTVGARPGGRTPSIRSVSDHTNACRLAEDAGRLLLDLRARGASGAEGDLRSHELLTTELAALYPDDAVLSEEGTDDSARIASSRVWIVDPLDGTREFGEAGRTDWAVHVALVIDGGPLVGAVALPAQGRVMCTADPPPPPADPPSRPRMLVSRSRPPAWADAVAAELRADLVPMGSAGAKIAAVVQGDADVYVHSGGQYEWDSAAPVAVALSAGLHASRVNGEPLRYNQPNPWLPDLVVCHPSLAGRVLAALAPLL
jgi:3'(2'), 5'-bisphosphate nucleotidase